MSSSLKSLIGKLVNEIEKKEKPTQKRYCNYCGLYLPKNFSLAENSVVYCNEGCRDEKIEENEGKIVELFLSSN